MVLCRVGVWPGRQGEAPRARPPRRQPGLHLPLPCIIHGHAHRLRQCQASKFKALGSCRCLIWACD